MVEIELRVIEAADVADQLARRLRADVAEADGVAGARLVRRQGQAEERGIVDEIGKVAVKLATGGGAEAVVAAVRSVLAPVTDREVVVKLPDGTEFTLKRGRCLRGAVRQGDRRAARAARPRGRR
jgi:hypothetical protein